MKRRQVYNIYFLGAAFFAFLLVLFYALSVTNHYSFDYASVQLISISPTVNPVSSVVSTPTLIPTANTIPSPDAVSSPNSISTNSAMNYRFGISVGNTLPGLSDGELNKVLDDFSSLKLGWLRFDIDWQNIQFDGPDKFDWRNIDRIVSAASERNIKMLPVLAYTPKWARPPSCSDSSNCPPDNMLDYGEFVRQSVKRYKSKGIYAWEIWNEPNLMWYWRPSPSAADYVEMLKMAHMIIKEEDPSAYVILGGLGPGNIKKGDINQLDFLKQIYALGAQPYFEVLGFHPYSYPVPPSYYQNWSAWSQMESTPTSLRSIMKNNGDDTKPIWLTEYGAPTNGPGYLATMGNYNMLLHPDHVSEDLQAEMLRDAFGSVQKLSWSGPLFWYSYKDLGMDVSTNENFFGLIRFDGSRKPAYEMISRIISLTK